MDVHFFANPKIRALGKVHGNEGLLAIVDIYMAMSRATDAIIEFEALIAIAEDWKVKFPEKFFQYCLDRGLVQVDGHGYTNSVVVKDQEQYAQKCKKTTDRQGSPGESRPPEVFREIFPGSLPGNTPFEEKKKPDSDIDIDNEDLKKEWNVPPVLYTAEVRKALNLWDKNLRKFGKALDQISLEALLSQYHGRPKDLIADIQHTVTNGWKSLQRKAEQGKPLAPQPATPSRPQPKEFKPAWSKEEEAKPSEESKAKVKSLISKAFPKLSPEQQKIADQMKEQTR